MRRLKKLAERVRDSEEDGGDDSDGDVLDVSDEAGAELTMPGVGRSQVGEIMFIQKLLGEDPNRVQYRDLAGALKPYRAPPAKFSGRVMANSKDETIVSFPGVYEKEWHKITSSESRISVACVFYPDTKKHCQERHMECFEPLINTDGECMCKWLYGKQVPWACKQG